MSIIFSSGGADKPQSIRKAIDFIISDDQDIIRKRITKKSLKRLLRKIPKLKKARLPRKQKKRIKQSLTVKEAYFSKAFLSVIARTNMAYGYNPYYKPKADPHRRTWKLIKLAEHYAAGPLALYKNLKPFNTMCNPPHFEVPEPPIH